MEYLYHDAADAGQRLDVWLADELGSLSRSAVRKLIDAGHVSVGGEPVRASHRLKPGEAVSVTVPEAVEPDIPAEAIPLDILYEDAHLVVVNKPQGMVVHPAPGHYSGTLVNALMYHCDNLSGINGVLRPGIVHRIDRDTSGVLVVAKTDTAHRLLTRQLADHSMFRKYHALARFNIKQDTGTVDAPVGRHPTDRKKMAVIKDGRTAVTHYRVLERFGDYTYLEARLETGRTHQIRVHMAYIGHPLLGDAVYGKPDKRLNGQALHAKALGFIHPHSGGYMEFDTELPEYFNKILNK